MRNSFSTILIALTEPGGLFQVDLFLTYPVGWEELRGRADAVQLYGVPVLVSSRADLIRAKEAVQPLREKDRWDLRVLRELMEEESADDG